MKWARRANVLRKEADVQLPKKLLSCTREKPGERVSLNGIVSGTANCGRRGGIFPKSNVRKTFMIYDLNVSLCTDSLGSKRPV